MLQVEDFFLRHGAFSHKSSFPKGSKSQSFLPWLPCYDNENSKFMALVLVAKPNSNKLLLTSSLNYLSKNEDPGNILWKGIRCNRTSYELGYSSSDYYIFSLLRLFSI